MIYGHSVFRFSDPPIDFTEDPASTELVHVTPEGSQAPLESDPESDEEMRSVYDGSISDSVLSSLGSYFNLHAAPYDKYFIWRDTQSTYRLVFGATSDYVSWTGAQEVIYTTASGYNTFPTFSKGRSGSFSLSSADVSNNSAYIYSSLDTHLPDRYVDTNRFLPVLAVMLLVTALAYAIYRLVNHALFRRSL